MTGQRSRAQLELESLLRRLDAEAQLLPALTPENGAAERHRLVARLRSGAFPSPPRFTTRGRKPAADTWSQLERARRLVEHVPAADLYSARLEELELDLCMLDALGDAKRIRPLARRRFGTGEARVQTAAGSVPVADVASAILSTLESSDDPPQIPADAPGSQPSLAGMMRRAAASAGVQVEVRVEPRLTASAATGDRIIYIADRAFGRVEALRLTVHEVLGHLVAAANGRTQPMRLLELGTAGSFCDQEGVALHLEEQVGVMDGSRLRTLAARVVATDSMHAGAPFGEVARSFVEDHGFSPAAAIALCERAYRGGGVARDAGYLRGWLRVRRAVATAAATIDELRSGRVGLDDLPTLRVLATEGLYRSPIFRPNLEYSLSATQSGTSPRTSPPSLAASLTMFELT